MGCVRTEFWINPCVLRLLKHQGQWPSSLDHLAITFVQMFRQYWFCRLNLQILHSTPTRNFIKRKVVGLPEQAGSATGENQTSIVVAWRSTRLAASFIGYILRGPRTAMT